MAKFAAKRYVLIVLATLITASAGLNASTRSTEASSMSLQPQSVTANVFPGAADFHFDAALDVARTDDDSRSLNAPQVPGSVLGANNTQVTPPSQDCNGITCTLMSPTGGLIIDVEVDPNDPSTIYAVGWQKTWRSTDQGQTWTVFKSAYLGQDLEVSPADSNVVYLAQRTSILKTVDGGISWTTLSHNGGSYSLKIDPKNSNIIYAGGVGAVSRSTDAGLTWVKTDVPGMNTVHDIDISTADSTHLALGDRSACFWMSRDSGTTWNKVRCATGSRGSIRFAPSNPQRVYASNGISEDGGATWRDINPGRTWTIAVHPQNPDVAYYGAPGYPVRATTDGGKTFYEIQGSGPNIDGNEVEGLAIDPINDILYVAGDSVFKGTDASLGTKNIDEIGVGLYEINFTDLKATDSALWVSSDARGIQGVFIRAMTKGLHGRTTY